MRSIKRIIALVVFLGQLCVPALAADEASISGTAFDNAGNPLAGVVVQIDGTTQKSTTTDPSGKFSFSIPAGTYTVHATHSGFEPATASGVVLVANQVVDNFNVTLVPQTLQSLRVIGSVSTTATRSAFNTSGLSVSTLDNSRIVARQQTNLSKIVGELPGVSASQNSAGRDPNSNWDIRGASIETKVAIDGHVVSSGVFGNYNTIYANPDIFQQVEVLKGAGLNGVNAGEAAIGTVNLRTRNFTGQNVLTGTLSTDSYGSGHYDFNYEHQFLNGKLSLMLARAEQGYLGPDNNVPGPVGNSLGGTTLPTYTGGFSLFNWSLPLSHPYVTLADLGKLRYKFSDATSLTGEFLHLTGRYTAQGGSYAINDGSFVIPQCANGTGNNATFVPAGGAGCNQFSTYNNPRENALIGSTQSLYSYFPNSTIFNEEPQFSLELRTTYKNDTIFVRPYWTEIRRNIDGAQEDLLPGNNGGWFQVVNPAQCTVQFSNPNAAKGTTASGPCFSAADGYTTPFVNTPNAGTVPLFPTTSTNPGCSVATPCYTTPTGQLANGTFAFGTPFSQPEFDKLNGVTFSWLHPHGNDLYSFSVDYSSDYTTKLSGDTSTLPNGCFATVGGGANNPNLSAAAGGGPNPFFQPNCQVGGVTLTNLPRTAVQIPPTTNYKTDVSLTALWQLSQRLQVGFGNYLSFERLNYQFTNPAAAVAATALGVGGEEQANATLLGGVASHAHYDPHVQLAYRLNNDMALRATAGSSITTPYAGLVSGFVKLTPNGGTNGTTDILSQPDANLLPEVTVAYDAGLDVRTHDGSVISLDAYDNNIHNVFVNIAQFVPNLPGRPPTVSQTIQNETINGPDELEYGLELTAQRNPAEGFGYYATGSLERAFYYGFSNAFYAGLISAGNGNFTGLVNGKQLDGTGGFAQQIPYFKAKTELNYMFAQQKAYVAGGLVLNGANNPYGTRAFTTAYANGSYNLTHDIALGVSVENLFQFNNGTFHGQDLNNAGFEPLGVKWNPACSCLINGPADGTTFPFNSAVVVQPRTIFITLTKRI